jgi:TonB-linked SusC/RagA family outer membrane protein
MAEASGRQVTETPTLSMRFALRAEVIKNLFVDVAYNNRTSYTQTVRPGRTYDVYTPNPATSTLNYSAAIGDSSLNYSNNRFKSNQYFASATYGFVPLANHNVKVQAGFQALDNYVESISATRFGLQYPDRPYFGLATGQAAPTVGGGAFENAVAGFFGRINYDYKGRYLLELTGRRDGSSRFSQLADNQWGFFPGASAGWVISKEKFMNNFGFIDFAKLRVSYGALGNQDIGGTPNDNYPFVALLDPGTANYFNNVLTRGFSLLNYPNVNISWEKSTQSNIGVDFTVLKNKLNFTFDYYQKKVTDMIVAIPPPSYVGIATSPNSGRVPVNVGDMVNKGWEFSTTYRNKVGKLNYSVTGNLSDVKNKVLETGGQDIVGQSGLISRAGFPINSYNLFVANGLYQTGDNTNFPRNNTRVTGPGDIRFVDLNGDSLITPAGDRMLTGNNFPRYEYSFDLNVNYRNFDLNIFLYGVGKRDNYISGVGVEPFNAGNWIASGFENILDRWTPKNPSAKYPRLYAGGNGNYVPSTYWLQNGAFLRIKHVTLGYNVPLTLLSRAKMQQFRLFVSVVNPFTFSNYEKGFDPEISNTNGAFYPIMRTATAGVNIRF